MISIRHSQSGRKTDRSFSYAFTLVELLVVIGIIALLISILLPALNNARRAALNVKCSANLHNLGNALFNYASSNKGQLPQSVIKPPAGSGNGHGRYLWDIEVPTRDMIVRAGGNRSSFYCPASPGAMNFDYVWTYKYLINDDASMRTYLASNPESTTQNMIGIIGYVNLLFRPDPASSYPGIRQGGTGDAYLQGKNDTVWTRAMKTWKYQRSIVPDNRNCVIATSATTIAFQKSNSSSETEIFADIIGSQLVGTTEDFSRIFGGLSNDIYQGTSHMGKNKTPAGANVLFLDGHVTFRPFTRQSRYHANSDGPTLPNAAANNFYDQSMVHYRTDNTPTGMGATENRITWWW